MIGPTLKILLNLSISFVCQPCLIYEYMNEIWLRIFNKKAWNKKIYNRGGSLRLELWSTSFKYVHSVFQNGIESAI